MPKKLPEFCQRLRSVLAVRGMSEYRLAKLSGLKAQTIARLTAGSVPNVETARAVADGLGLSLDWLCGREGAEKNFGKSEIISPTAVD